MTSGLKLEKILVELEEPIFYTARDEDNNLYLVLLIGGHKKLFTRVLEKDIINMLENKITMQDIFTMHPENRVFYEKEIDERFYITEDICNNISIDNLPSDEYFGNLNKELSNYLNKLKN